MTTDPEIDTAEISEKTVISKPRLVAVFAFVLIAVSLAYYVSRKPPAETRYLPKCTFYELSHLHCPGCGSTRLTYALLNGEFYIAFRNNPLLFIALPFLLIGVASEAKRFVCGRPIFKKRLSPKFIMFLFFLISAYWVLRNVPVFPFNLLAPIG